ncbi:MAG: OmpA family protein [Muribaculaceae bacterium]|nr:OmpA family protein [Muribaculaceae bacterium]
MKRLLLAAAVLATGCLFGISAQNVIERPTLADNWNIGVDAGVTTPLTGHSFFQNMRGQYGLHLGKQLTPIIGAGIEGAWGVNTTRSATAFDTQYVGLYGTADLMTLFGGFSCTPRCFTIDAVLGAGWLHGYYAHAHDTNDMGAKFGLNFNFNCTDNFSISVKPSVIYNVTNGVAHLDAKRATFNCMVGFNYNFGPGFKCVNVPVDYSGDLAALNDQVNALRADLEGTAAALAATTAENAALAASLAECQNRPAQVVADSTLQSVRYIFFKIGSAVITPDQQPNVEMVAAYLNNHPESTVVVKGYASQDGNLDFNLKLAAKRAEAVKTALIKRYKINPDRIKAEGQGIGHMFSEESWNRVSICTLETNK